MKKILEEKKIPRFRPLVYIPNFIHNGQKTYKLKRFAGPGGFHGQAHSATKSHKQPQTTILTIHTYIRGLWYLE